MLLSLSSHSAKAWEWPKTVPKWQILYHFYICISAKSLKGTMNTTWHKYQWRALATLQHEAVRILPGRELGGPRYQIIWEAASDIRALQSGH